MAGNIDVKHLVGDAAIEALDHAIGLRRIRPGRAMADLDFRAGAFKIIGGEAGVPIRQLMGDAEGEGLSGGFEESNRIGGVLGFVDFEVDKTEIIVVKVSLPLAGLHRRLGWSSIEALGLQDTINAIAVEIWQTQKVPEYEGEIVQREACCSEDGADDGALLLANPPGKALRSA